MSTEATAAIVGPNGQRIASASKTCPGCGKPECRQPAGTFGDKYELCANCGHEYRERQL